MNISFIEKINRENILKYFPDLHKLEVITEKNICHNDESVFNHTMQVFDNCKVILNLLRREQLGYFNEVIGKNKIKDLFLVATLFHDIGKFKTIKTENYITTCKEHEKIGAKLLRRTHLNELDDEEFEYVQKIIESHDLIQLSLDDRDNFDEEYSKLEKEYSNMILEMTILGIADIYNGDLKKNNKQEYDYRIKNLSNKVCISLM